MNQKPHLYGSNNGQRRTAWQQGVLDKGSVVSVSFLNCQSSTKLPYPTLCYHLGPAYGFASDALVGGLLCERLMPAFLCDSIEIEMADDDRFSPASGGGAKASTKQQEPIAVPPAPLATPADPHRADEGGTSAAAGGKGPKVSGNPKAPNTPKDGKVGGGPDREDSSQPAQTPIETVVPVGAPVSSPVAPVSLVAGSPVQAPAIAPAQAPAVGGAKDSGGKGHADEDAKDEDDKDGKEEKEERDFESVVVPTPSPTKTPSAAPTTASTESSSDPPTNFPTGSPTEAPVSSPVAPVASVTGSPVQAAAIVPAQAPVEVASESPVGAPATPTQTESTTHDSLETPAPSDLVKPEQTPYEVATAPEQSPPDPSDENEAKGGPGGKSKGGKAEDGKSGKGKNDDQQEDHQAGSSNQKNGGGGESGGQKMNLFGRALGLRLVGYRGEVLESPRHRRGTMFIRGTPPS